MIITNLKFIKTLTAGFVLAAMSYSQSFARDEITCPSGTASGSTCWKCGDNCTATLTGGKMTVSGTGAMYDFGSKSVSGSPSWASNAPWADHQLEMTSIEIGNGITRVGDHDFALAYNVTEIKLGNTLESLGTSAFHSSSVSEIKIPASVKTLGNYAFGSGWNRGNGPTSVVFEEGSHLESMGEGAFHFTRITEIDLPDTVKYIGVNALGATGLTTIVLPNNPNLVLDDQIFCGGSVTSIIMPEEGVVSASSALRNLPGNPTVYCTQKQISAGKCSSSYLYKSPLTVAHYERDGDHYNIYDSQGNIVKQYRKMADFGTTKYYAKRTYYTPAEAAQHVNHTNNNKVIFTFK